MSLHSPDWRWTIMTRSGGQHRERRLLSSRARPQARVRAPHHHAFMSQLQKAAPPRLAVTRPPTSPPRTSAALSRSYRHAP